MVGGDRWCAFKSRSKTVIYSDLPLAHIRCPAVPFKTAPALECLLLNISSTLCPAVPFKTAPALECLLLNISSTLCPAVPFKTAPALECLLLNISSTLCPAVPFKTAPALECLLLNISSTVCFPIPRALLRLVPGSTFLALQRELRSSAFPNQTDNLSLRCFSRKSKNYSFSRLVPSLLHGGR